MNLFDRITYLTIFAIVVLSPTVSDAPKVSLSDSGKFRIEYVVSPRVPALKLVKAVLTPFRGAQEYLEKMEMKVYIDYRRKQLEGPA